MKTKNDGEMKVGFDFERQIPFIMGVCAHVYTLKNDESDG